MNMENIITKDSIIGDVIKLKPGAEKIIEKYFGNGCFTCPGIKMETIAFGCTMHGKNPDELVKELNQI